MDDEPEKAGKTLRDYEPSLPKALLDNRRRSGEVLPPPPVDLPRNSPRHSTAGNNYGRKGVPHPWLVTLGEDEGTWDVVGGEVYTQGGLITVADTTIIGGLGFAVLEITRNTVSRGITGASILWVAADPDDSTEATQYRVLAKLDPDEFPSILQLQFEEIRIWELMIVENGEFALMGAEMSHRNTYAPPPP
jgi:hypothetical protein